MAGGTQRSSNTRSSRKIALPTALALILLTIGLSLSSSPASAETGWELILDRPTPSFGGMAFVSNDEGWLVAGGGLLKTTDGGATWQEAAKITAIDVDFADASHGWLVGPSGAIYGTTDGGETWTQQDSGTDVHLREVYALSATEAFATGRGRGYSDIIVFPAPTVLLHTSDGGATWQSVELPPKTSFSEMVFAGSSGWLLGQGCTPPSEYQYCTPDTVRLFRTSDGGATWSLLETDLPRSVRSLTFADATHGWLSASSCISGTTECTIGVYRTTDGGSTWALSALDDPGFVGPTVFRNTMTGWLVKQDCNIAFTCSIGLPPTYVLRTDDGGVTWSPVSSFDLPSPHQTASALVLHGGTLFLTGSGVSLRSDDEGQTWSPVQHPAMAFDSNVDFVDRDRGYLISRGDLLRTTDAGRDWDRVGSIPNGARSFIRFLDANTGFTAARVCNGAGACAAELWRTADGGETWQQVLTIDDENAYVLDVRFVGEERGYAAFSTGLAVSDDGGSTWSVHPAPPGWRLSQFDVADPTHLWAILATTQYPPTYELRQSADEGRTWQTMQALPEYTTLLLFVDQEHGWYIDHTCTDQCAAKLHQTTDGGASWHEQDPGARAVNDLVFVDRLNGWANATSPSFGHGEALLHTADGGETWTPQLTGDFVVGQLEFVDVTNGWLALSPRRGKGIGGGPINRTQLYHTTDGGGGPIGVVPTPTVQLPDVGSYAPADDGSGTLPLALLLSGFVLAFGAGGLTLIRRRSRV